MCPTNFHPTEEEALRLSCDAITKAGGKNGRTSTDWER
jgi:hypothetical protein